MCELIQNNVGVEPVFELICLEVTLHRKARKVEKNKS
jgi:hypothetical protein